MLEVFSDGLIYETSNINTLKGCQK